MSIATDRSSAGGPARAGHLAGLTVAVTGATGTVGAALLPRLLAAADVARVVVLGRRRPELSASTLEFRSLDLRAEQPLEDVIDGVDVVIHLACALYGIASREDSLFATNVEGTANLARAATSSGVRRFVYTSSAIVYGPRRHRTPLDERAPISAPSRHFYARHKAQAETVVRAALAGGDIDLFVFRPCAIVGPHAAGAASHGVPRPARAAARHALGLAAHAGLRPAMPAPPVPLQFVHEDDVAAAVLAAALGEGPAGTYNLAGEGALDGAEVLRLLGLRPLPLPGALARGGLRLLARVPPLVPATGWAEVLAGPLILDCDAARTRLGWRPRYSSRAALLDTRHALGW